MTNPIKDKLFCDYRAGISMCGMLLKPGQLVCKRHQGKVSKHKIASPKFRGDSSWQKENGMGKGKSL